MHPSKDDTNATKRKDLVHHFSASTVNPKLFVFMEDIISDYCHETSITRYPTLIKGVKGLQLLDARGGLCYHSLSRRFGTWRPETLWDGSERKSLSWHHAKELKCRQRRQ